jgi:hypothetical protein
MNASSSMQAIVIFIRGHERGLFALPDLSSGMVLATLPGALPLIFP